MNSKPKLVIVTGRPGSGKTTLSKELGRILHFPTVIRDEIKEGYVNTFNVKHDRLTEETNGIVSNFFFEVILLYLSKNVSLIAEAAFPHSYWESGMPSFSKHGDIFFVICDVSPELAAQRHLERGLKDPNREFYHGDKRVSYFRSTGIVLPDGSFVYPAFDVPTFKVSTIEGYSPSLEDIGRQIVGPRNE